MTHRVCPWWLGYWLISPLRNLWQNPHEMLVSHVHEGMTVLEPGPGMGYFTLELARLVGPSGRVIAVDVQPKMLDRLKRRAAKAGLLDRVDARVAPAESMGLPTFGVRLASPSPLRWYMNFQMRGASLLRLLQRLNPARRSWWPNPAGTSRRLRSMLNCKVLLRPASNWLSAHPSGAARLRF